MVDRNKLTLILNEYDNIEESIDSIISMIKTYEEIYMNKPYGEMQKFIRLMKIFMQNTKDKLEAVNIEFDELMSKAD